VRGAAWAETAAISAAALLAALGVFGGFVALRGLNPLDVYAALVAGGFGSWFSLEETLTQAAPIMLTALCTALPARAGLLVIGGEGALVVGGVATVLAGVNLGGLPPPLALALMCLAGALGGGLWVGVAGALRHWRGVNETIATLLLNYIAIAVMNHLVAGPIRDFGQVLKPASWAIGERLMIGAIPATGIHWGLVFGIVACVGFAVDVVGGNVRAAQIVGLPIGAIVLATTVLGGAAAGLAGAIEVVAVHGFASSSLVVGYGYAGILVAFLARQNPLAVIAVAVLLGGITASGGLLQRRFGLPDAATLVLEGLLFIALLAANTLYGRWRRA